MSQAYRSTSASLLVRSFAGPCALACLLSACGDTSTYPPITGGSPRLSPDGLLAVGLGYNEVGTIGVDRYDAQGRPSPGVQVRFAIFGEPAGSTLSVDRVYTDDAGHASVTLTAGTAEASFRVQVTSEGVDNLEYYVSVSRFRFITLGAHLGYAGADTDRVSTLRALLYDDRPCSRLAPTVTYAAALAMMSAPGSSATIQFPYLLERTYALVGRAEDAHGRLQGYGCVDLDAGQLHPGAVIEVPVPLARVTPAVVGVYRVETALALPAAASPMGAWHTFADCPNAPGQPLLDGILRALGDGPVATALAAHRGPEDGQGCRPSKIKQGNMMVDSADATLAALLEPKGAPSLMLPTVVADLDAIVAATHLASRLTVPAGPAGPAGARPVVLAEHTLDTAELAAAGGAPFARYDLAALGFPINSTTVELTLPTDGPDDRVDVGAHALTLRLPLLWKRALAELALVPRGLPTDTRALVAAIVAAAARPGGGQPLVGCAAVEDLLCQIAGARPCAVEPACKTAASALGAALDAPFAAPLGIDLRLHGTARILDENSDLLGERLVAGTWSAELVLGPAAPAVVLSAPWSGALVP